MSVSTLVVDDGAEVADLFRQHFRREVRRRHRAAAYRNPVRHQHAGMDGLELLRKIQAAAIRSRSNRVSPYGVTSGAGGTGEYGAAEFVTKPADFEIVKTQLRQLSTAADQEARRSLE